MRRLALVTSIATVLAAAVCPAPPARAGAPPTLHEGLERLRADDAAGPAAVAATTRLAKEFGTPLYVYDAATIRARAAELKAAFASRFPKLKIHYAVKANTNLAILRILFHEGFAPEVISRGEILASLAAGAKESDVLFTSSSKNPAEIEMAVKGGAILNVDSREELEQIEAAAARLKRKARISFRINPGVDPHTIHQINTGISESKFGLHLEGGIAFSAYERAKALPHVDIVGAHCHIGSQITETEGYEATARKMLAFAAELKEKLGVTLGFIDLGGGIGIPYHDGETVMTPDDLAKALKPIWDGGVKAMGYEPALWIEPGRFLVAQSGFLVTRVNSIKKTPVKTFVNVDSGFNTLVRPAMYQAYHRIRLVGETGPPEKVDVAGDVCETVDILGADRMLPPAKDGDLMVILDAGAYGFSMASEYNSRPLPAEVLVDGDAVRVIRRRGTFDDLFRGEERARPAAGAAPKK